MRQAVGNKRGWAVTGVLAALVVVWLTATTFGVPGLFLASATSDPTPRTAPAPRTPPTIAQPTSAPSSASATIGSTIGSTIGTGPRGLVTSQVINRPTESPAAPTRTSARPSAPTGRHPQPTATPTPTIDQAARLTTAVRASQARCPQAARGVQEHASHAGPKTVALTFDDGPGEATPEVLDILAREHVHATFFVIGRQASMHPELVRRAVQEGHLVGNHTFDHTYPRDLRGGWSPGYLSSQLFRTSEVVFLATGQPTCFFRPPGGFLPRSVLPAAHKLRMTTTLWSVDTRDWEVQGEHAPSAARRVIQSRTILYRAVDGGKQDPHPIVLFHDGGGYRGSTAASLTRVIDWYKANGFTFVRVDGQV